MRLHCGYKLLSAIALMILLSCKPYQKAADLKSTQGAASGAPSESMMSPRMREFRDQFVAMQTSDDADKLFRSTAEALRNGDLQDNDIRLIAAQIYPLLKLRGIYWRLSKTVEGNASNNFHSLVVTSLMQMATGARIFNPSADLASPGPWQAINHYFLYPYQGIGAQFASIGAMQDFMVQDVVPDIAYAIGKVEAMNIPADKAAVWDNQLIFGRGTFGDDSDLHDRFITISEGERELLLSGLYLIKHNTLFSSAYDYEEFPELVQKLGKLIGMDGFLATSVDGMSAKDRAAVICPSRANGQCEGKFARLFTLRGNGAAYLADAYNDLVASVQHLDAAWKIIRTRDATKANDFQLLDPQKLLPWTRLNDISLSNMKALVRGEPIRSAVTGHVIKVNYPEFYKNPPHDLKAFIPVDFSDKPKRLDIAGFTNVRNYEYGYSTMWNAEAYAPYFPDVKSGKEVPSVLKDLSQAWGGWMAGIPLATMSMVF